MATHFSSETEYKAIKRAIDSGKPRKLVMEKYDIGTNKYYRMRKSLNYEDYKKLTNDETKKREASRKRSASLRASDGTCHVAAYGPGHFEQQNSMVGVSLVIAFIVLIIVLALLVISAVA